MGPCCVEGCELTSQETFYFEFPTSRLLRRKWLEVIPIPGKLPLGTVVCSRHFSADDYENVRGKVRLKRRVVPTLLLDHKKPTSPKETLPKSPTPPPPEPANPQPQSPPPAPSSQMSPIPPAPVSPKTTDTCDSTTVSVPSPVDAEKLIDDIQKRIAVTVNSLQAQNGVSRVEKTVVRSPPPLDQKEDIEDMITNYHIKNKVPNPALLADLVPDCPQPGPESAPECSQPGTQPVRVTSDSIEIEDVKEAEPVFIEISVDKDANTAGAGSQDCLMLLESVQVEVDPATLMLHDDYFDTSKKEDPISLLTSSDEDDVILQEPHIDTVEVSDETDEDDMPLVKLVKKTPDKKKVLKKKPRKQRSNIEKIMWGLYDFYCVQCHFTTTSSLEYNKHLSEHSTVLQVCQICGYTSASKSMFSRHTRIHKVEKKFKCHLCDYRARHKMSLIFHLKNHDSDTLVSAKNSDTRVSAKNDTRVKKKSFKCRKCDFKSDSKLKVFQHFKLCSKDKKHVCSFCEYSTKKKSDLRRHVLRRHADVNNDDDDVEFLDE
nr:zinc finger protein ZFAT isoform X2 [Helicoverpa armigera]